jgi:hypothetical protein
LQKEAARLILNDKNNCVCSKFGIPRAALAGGSVISNAIARTQVAHHGLSDKTLKILYRPKLIAF